MEIKEIETCRICGYPDLLPVLDLGIQALSGVFPSPAEPAPARAPLKLVKCNDAKNPGTCGLLQLKHSVPPAELYSHSYGYRSGINRTMSQHLRSVATRVQQMVDLQDGDVVIDIGSNDATLLKCYPQTLRRIGIDPTGEQFRDYYSEGIELVCDYFSSANLVSVSPPRKAKVITSIAMFYDLEAPLDFVSDIQSILDAKGIWVLEQSYMPTMLRMNSFDTICHEHLEYYSLKQIDWMLRRRGLRILDVEFNEINGGSFRVYACHADATFESNRQGIDQVFTDEEGMTLHMEAPYSEFRDRVLHIKQELHGLLTTQKATGKAIYVYGASTKGNVLLQFCGVDHTLITAAADRNPDKWGRRTPATDIPIVSEEDARRARPDYFLVLPWHFRAEFLQREADFRASGGKFIFPLPQVEVI